METHRGAGGFNPLSLPKLPALPPCWLDGKPFQRSCTNEDEDRMGLLARTSLTLCCRPYSKTQKPSPNQAQSRSSCVDCTSCFRDALWVIPGKPTRRLCLHAQNACISMRANPQIACMFDAHQVTLKGTFCTTCCMKAALLTTLGDKRAEALTTCFLPCPIIYSLFFSQQVENSADNKILEGLVG